MKDIKLTKNDIKLVDGDLPLVEGLDRTLQHIDTGLFIMLGDWILDYTQGIDYINGLKAYPEIMRSQIKNAIKSVEGVDTVLKFKMERKSESQKYMVTATVKCGNSEIPVNKEVGAFNNGN